MSHQADTLQRGAEPNPTDRPNAEVVRDTRAPEAAAGTSNAGRDAAAEARDRVNQFAIPTSEMLDPGAVASVEATTPEVREAPGYVEQPKMAQQFGAGIVQLREAELARINSGR